MYPLRPDRKNRRIFCDESSQTGHRFFVLGGLYHDENHEDIENELEAIKLKYWLMDEVKWGKCPKKPGQFFEGYKALIDGFARLPIYMKIIIVDTGKYPLDHPTHFDGDAELGYFKFYYQLLYSGIISRNSERNYLVLVDEHEVANKDRIVDLERCINRSAQRQGFADMEDGSRCCNIEEAPSWKYHSIQLADLLIGAVAAHWNKKVSNPVKLSLIQHLSDTLDQDLGKASSWGYNKLNRWVFHAK